MTRTEDPDEFDQFLIDSDLIDFDEELLPDSEDMDKAFYERRMTMIDDAVNRIREKS